MASKTSRSAQGRHSATAAATTTAASAGNAAPGADFTLAHEQVQTLVSLTDLMFKGAEELRRFQMQTAHDAHQRYQRALSDVSAATNPTELLNLQSELVRYDLEAGSRYWQQLASIVAASQAEMVNLLTRSAATLGGDVAKIASQSQAAGPSALTAAAKSGAQTDLDPTQAWNRLVDMGKQWTDMLYRTEAALH
jgi:phasin family protein